MKKLFFYSISLLLILLTPAAILAKDEILSIPTRSGITLNYFLKSAKPKSDNILVMFPRGGGQGHFLKSEKGFIFSEDFLMRTMGKFAGSGFDVAVVGLPSDRVLMDDEFRLSEEHRKDIAKMLENLTGKGYRSIYLLSSGSGSISATALAARPLPAEVKGLVLAASLDISRLPNPPDLGQIKFPTLIIHHEDDKCEGFTIDASNKIKAALVSSKVSFVTVTGGKPAVEDECGNLSTHGFYGSEDHVVQTILSWIAGKPLPVRLLDK